MASLLEAEEICKSFSGNAVLKNISLVLNGGECLALVGENGAGKSTLMKIFSGIYKMDSGRMKIQGDPVEVTSPGMAKACGVSIIHQELSLIPNLTVAQNIFLGNEIRGIFGIDDKAMEEKAGELLRELGIAIEPGTSVVQLTVAQQQLVEIAKVLAGNARIIIMDEPTAALSFEETEKLFAIVENLKKNGKGIIYISHRLEEIYRIAERICVLRDGRIIDIFTPEVPVGRVVEAMVGQSIQNYYPKQKTEPGEVVLEVKGLGDGKHYRDISFTVREGEVFGIAGLVGAGQIPLARGIYGTARVKTGEIFVKGRKMTRHSPKESISGGMALVTENRKEEGLILSMSVKENIGLSPWAPMKYAGGVIDERAERETAEKSVEEYGIKTDSISKEVMLLSGGNQQKVVLAMILVTDPDVVIMCEPTRGVDVNGKVEIYQIINQLLARKKAVLLISSEIPEVLGMSDRIAILNKGQIVRETEEKLTEEEVMYFATGGHERG